MRVNVLLVLVAVCVVLMVTESFARDTFYDPETCYVPTGTDTCYVCRTLGFGDITQLDLGVCDTVRVGCPVNVDISSLAVGDSFPVQIYVYSSEAIGGFTLGFRHDGRGLKFGGYGDGWDPTGGILTALQQGGILWAVDTLPNGQPRPDSASALMGWIDMTANRPIPRNTTSTAKLLGSMWMVLTQEIEQTIRLDSLFYPPNGPFILVCRDSTPGGSYPFIDMKLTPKFVRCSEVASPPCDINLGDTPFGDCGDVDGSSDVNIADVVYMINYIFGNGAPPQDTSGGDIDCDRKVTIADVVYLINYVFRAGPKPCLGCE